MIGLIEKLVICVFEVMMFYDYLRNILTLRNRKRFISFSVYAVTGILWFGINLLDNSTLNLLGISVLLICVSLFLYEDAVRKILSHILIFIFLMAGIEFLGGWVYLTVFDEVWSIKEDFPKNEFLLAIIIKIITFMVLRVAKMYFSKNRNGNIGSYLKYVLILPITTFIVYSGILYINIQTEKKLILLLLGCVLLLFSNIVVFYILEKLGTVMEQNKAYEVERVQYELGKQHYDSMDEINANTNKYIHNLKEHLTAIGRLARENNNEDIIKILGDMETNIDIIVNKSYTANRLLNAILCEKEQLAKKSGVSMSISVEPHLDMDFIKSGDMIIMLGNLLQNAVEATGKGKDGYVKVSINGSEERFIVVIVENNYFEKIERSEGRYLSSKRGYREYGQGIRCIEETVEKYGGLLYLRHDGGVFKAILTIAKESKL